MVLYIDTIRVLLRGLEGETLELINNKSIDACETIKHIIIFTYQSLVTAL